MSKGPSPVPDLAKLAAEAFDLSSEVVLESMLMAARLSHIAAQVNAGRERFAEAGEPFAAPAQPPLLSRREEQVLRLLARGLSTKETASELGIAFKTAASHRASIMEKLDVHEAASMVREAIRRGIVQA